MIFINDKSVPSTGHLAVSVSPSTMRKEKEKIKKEKNQKEKKIKKWEKIVQIKKERKNKRGSILTTLSIHRLKTKQNKYLIRNILEKETKQNYW